MKRHNRCRKAFGFLRDKEKTSTTFTLNELAEASGWKISTIQTYISKKWKAFFQSDDSIYYKVHGIDNLGEEAFIRLSSQNQAISENPLKPPLSPTVESLVLKAREAAIAAVEIYNKPAISFKTYSFIVLMVIAWTSLLHAIFEKRGENYFYEEKDGTYKNVEEEKKAWELSKCIKKYFCGTEPAIVENIQLMIKLRNKIEHRFLPVLDLDIYGECQAFLLNFEDILVKEFGDYYSLAELISIPLQLSNITPEARLKAQRALQSNEYESIKNYIHEFRQGLSPDVLGDPKYSFRVYLIPKLGNHITSSDLAVEFVKFDPNEMDSYDRGMVFIKEKQVQVANQGMLKPKDVAKKVEEATGKEFKINHHTNAWKKYNVRPSTDAENKAACRPEFCQYDVAHKSYVYTQKWVKFLAEKVKDDSEYEAIKSFKCP